MPLPKMVRDAMWALELAEPRERKAKTEIGLARMYIAGMRSGVGRLVRRTEWTPAVKSVMADIRKLEKQMRF